ncbi:MAG: ATP-binding protein [Bdellovibrionota bacterium]
MLRRIKDWFREREVHFLHEMGTSVDTAQSKTPDISERLRQQQEEIMLQWEQTVRKELQIASPMSHLALRNSIPKFLARLTDSLTPQAPQLVSKRLAHEVSREHAHERAMYTGYTIEQVIHEYTTLREVVLDHLIESGPLPEFERKTIRLMFDRSIMEAAHEFTQVKSYLDSVAKAEAELAAKRLQDLQMVMEVALVRTPDQNQLLHDLLSLVKQVFHADSAAIHLAVDNGKSLVVRATSGRGEDVDDQVRIPVGGGVIGKVVQSKTAVIVPDLAQIEVLSPSLKNRGLKSFLGAPLRIENRAIGVIHVATLQFREFHEEDKTLLQLIADRIAIAVDHARLYSQIQRDNDLLHQERELRDRFVAALTHDLRGPITAAKTSAQILRRYIDRVDDRERSLVRIEDSLNRADTMIEDMLDANRIQAGQKLPLHIESFDMVSLAKDVVEELKVVSNHPIEFEARESISGFWCRRGIRRVMENLVTNAIKYGSPRRPVSVQLVHERGSLKLTVHNEGNPIRGANQDHLFQPFQRGDQAEHSGQKGWGIGLTLVKGIVEAHGGQVTWASSSEAGTTFTVSLPLDAR